MLFCLRTGPTSSFKCVTEVCWLLLWSGFPRPAWAWKEIHSHVLSGKLHSIQVRIHFRLLVSFLFFGDLSCLPQNGRGFFAFLLLLVSIRPSKFKVKSELVAWHEKVKTAPKGKILWAPLQFHHLVKKRTSVMNEMVDRSGIRTHESEVSATITQRLRPLGPPACKFQTRPAFVFVQGLHPLSGVSLEVIAFCNLLFHGFYLR